jgi:hypothetical protein
LGGGGGGNPWAKLAKKKKNFKFKKELGKQQFEWFFFTVLEKIRLGFAMEK